MANIVISTVCNASCQFCFAGDYMRVSKAQGEVFIPPTVFRERLEFLARSGCHQVRLLGGEPTLHPYFQDLVTMSIDAGFQIMVFSHGWIPAEALSVLLRLNPEQCTVLINMNASIHTDASSDDAQERRYEILKRLGPLAQAGFTIYQPTFSLDPLIQIVENLGLRKAIRLGLAHPTLKRDNCYVHPKQYPHIGAKIAAFARKATERGVNLELDCGFVRCMFTESQFQDLSLACDSPESHCSPVLDVDVDGSVFSCFPLRSRFSNRLSLESNATMLRDEFIKQESVFRIAGIYRECSSCTYKIMGSCSGGCLAATMLRFKSASVNLSIPNEFIEWNNIKRSM